jgi:hypothetical protein
VDKVAELCSRDKALLYEFSDLTLKRLRGISLLARPLKIFQKHIDINVMKEVEKDRLIIRHASAVFRRGGEIVSSYVDDVFEETKDVDHEYVGKMSLPLAFIEVRYEDIEDIRKQRIGCLSRAVCSLLSGWQDSEPFEEAVKAAFSVKRFHETLGEILHLYNLETMKLNRSIKLPPPFHRAIKSFTEALFEAMEAVAKEMVGECALKIYGHANDAQR